MPDSPVRADMRSLNARFATLKVLVVDDEHYMRKVVRTLLMSIGVRTIHEAHDGVTGLEAIRTLSPDIVILDWQMPGLDGAAFVRMVRSPDTFPLPDIPIIMLTGHAERSRVLEAVEIGVNEFLLKPVSTKALQDRLISVLAKPRGLAQNGRLSPRKMVAAANADGDEAIANLVLVN